MALYFSAILLPPDLNRDLHQIKLLLQERFGCAVALRAPAHITIVPPFHMLTELEASWLSAWDAWSRNLAPFEISVSGWDHFGKRTIFASPVLSPALNHLKKEADIFLRMKPEFGATPDNRPFHPHITIANRDIRPSDFHAIKKLVESFAFHPSFAADGISTLRYGQKKWDVIHTSRFQEVS